MSEKCQTRTSAAKRSVVIPPRPLQLRLMVRILAFASLALMNLIGNVAPPVRPAPLSVLSPWRCVQQLVVRTSPQQVQSHLDVTQPPILITMHKEIENSRACEVSGNMLGLGFPETQQGQPNVPDLFF